MCTSVGLTSFVLILHLVRHALALSRPAWMDKKDRGNIMTQLDSFRAHVRLYNQSTFRSTYSSTAPRALVMHTPAIAVVGNIHCFFRYLQVPHCGFLC